jgi:hypothetical protein
MFYPAIERRLRMAKMRRVTMDRVMSRARHIFALVTTFGLRDDRQLKTVRRRLKAFRRAWLHTIEQLCTNGLWSPVSDVNFEDVTPGDADRFDFAFGLCARCLPLCVRWRETKRAMVKRLQRKISAQIIPCRKTHFCPACFASLSANQYRKFKEVVNNLIAAGEEIQITARVTAVWVPAVPAADTPFSMEYLRRNTEALRAVLRAAKAQRDSLHKRLQRNTLGSFWRVIAVPKQNGWRVETRWVIIHRPDTSPPIEDVAGSVERSCHVIRAAPNVSWRRRMCVIDLDEKLAEALATFAHYPISLIRGDIDLIAAWLNASAHTKILLGTGLLRQAGPSLIAHYKKIDRRRRQRWRSVFRDKKTTSRQKIADV